LIVSAHIPHCRKWATTLFAVAVTSLAAYVSAATLTLPASHDTFIHEDYPNNNNGASDSLFVGDQRDNAGAMRALFRFDLPPRLAGRVTVTDATLGLTTRALGYAPTVAGSISIWALSVPWNEGNGASADPQMPTIGQQCTAGATWNRSECATGTQWSGGSKAIGSISGIEAVPAVPGSRILFGGQDVRADVQRWIDAPATNNGWWTYWEGNFFDPRGAQRFYSSEAGSPLDIDGNRVHDALTDGLLIVRYLFGLTGPNLIAGAIGPGATRTEAQAIKQQLDTVRPSLDVDGNTQVDALTDGLLIVRYLFGARGQTLTSRTVGSNATRATASAIEPHIQSLMTSGPTLSFTFSCKAGFAASGDECTTCTAAANASCAIGAAGNACIDNGPPAATYACACNSPGYVATNAGGAPGCAVGQ
jgi:hypothetical protein